MRAFDWDPIRAEHYGQRLHRRTKQAGHMTAPDQCCSNSESSCQGGAVAFAATHTLTCYTSIIFGARWSSASSSRCAAAWPLAARAQQGERMLRIGMLMHLAADDPEGQARRDALGLKHELLHPDQFSP